MKEKMAKKIVKQLDDRKTAKQQNSKTKVKQQNDDGESDCKTAY
jgi:hypothetical protein